MKINHIDGAVKGLELLKENLQLKGANATTLERAIITLKNSKKAIRELQLSLLVNVGD